MHVRQAGPRKKENRGCEYKATRNQWPLSFEKEQLGEKNHNLFPALPPLSQCFLSPSKAYVSIYTKNSVHTFTPIIMYLWCICYTLKKGSSNSWAAHKQIHKCSVDINLLISGFKHSSNSFWNDKPGKVYQMKYSNNTIKETFEQPNWLSG